MRVRSSQAKSTRIPRHAGTRVAIAVADFNTEITAGLLEEAGKALLENGVRADNIRTVSVPGAYELPYVANKLARTKRYDAVLCFGCVIKGETTHDLFVASWAAIGIGQVSLSTGVPVLFGVLTTKNEAQARRRSSPGALNRGREVAEAALRMIALNKEI